MTQTTRASAIRCRPRAPGATVAALSLLLLLAGCQGAVVGEWRLVQASPNRQVFSIDQAGFRSDGTYSARTTIEGQTTEETGTYEYDGAKLKLRPQAGGVRVYRATRTIDRLEIGDGQRHVVLAPAKRGS